MQAGSENSFIYPTLFSNFYCEANPCSRSSIYIYLILASTYQVGI